MTCWKDTADYQKERVYRWERQFASGRHLSFADIPAFIKRVWEAEGLYGAPLLEEMPTQTRKWAGDATRSIVRFPKTGATEKTVLHELAHSMTQTVKGHCDAHGPDFVGLYIQLLDKYLSVPSCLCWYTAKKDGVEFNMFAKPWIGK